jgi:hypothetical protein
MNAWIERFIPDVRLDSAIAFRVYTSERKQGNVPRLLHSRRHHALMPRAGAGLPARADSPILADVFPEQVGLLVINRQGFVCAELAELGFCKEAAFAAAFAAFRRSALFSYFSHL